MNTRVLFPWTKEELETILEKEFLLNNKAFAPGRTNDDVVDSMLICFALDREWTELFAKWLDNFGNEEGGYIEYSDRPRPYKYNVDRILEHYNRVKKWMDMRFKDEDPGEIYPAMYYTINY